MSKASCEFCDKRGLPILMVRDAIAPSESGAPVATGQAVTLGGKGTKYTKRVLRSGYAYVYDEARKRLESYFITADGYYFRLADSVRGKAVVPIKPFNCPDEGHRAIASCITISDPRHATKVWIGFSDVQWTDAVKKLHLTASVRKRHMQELDIKAILGGAHPTHSEPISKIDSAVAEYALDPSQGRAAFKWCPFPFTSRKSSADRMKAECNKLRPGVGVIVTLEDPAGVVQELAAMMASNATRFFDDPKAKRSLAVSSTISGLEMSIKNQAELDEIVAADQIANDQISKNPLGHALFESTRKRTEEMRRVTPEEADLAGKNAWAAYTKKFNDPARRAWQEQFDSRFNAFDKDYIAPLAVAHADWMRSQSMTAMMETNYDSADADSGIVYVMVVRRMIEGTQDKKACLDLYGEWLEGKCSDVRNLLLRGLVSNQDELADKVHATATSHVDVAEWPWDKLIEANTKATERLLGNEADELGKLVASFAGPAARLFMKAASSKIAFEGLAALGWAARHPVVAVDLEGGKKAFRALMIRQMSKLTGAKPSERELRRAVADEFKRLEVHGVSMSGTEKKRFLLFVDESDVKGMPKGLSGADQAKYLARTIRTPEQVEDLNLSKWRNAVKGGTHASVPFAFAALAVVAQFVALSSLKEKEAEAMRHDKSESLRRLYAQGAQAAGAIADVLALGLVRLAPLAPRLGAGIATATGLTTLFRIGGRVLGIGGSLVMASFDLFRAFEEYKAGNTQGMAAYGIAGALGIAATLFLVFGWTGVGMILVLIIVLWSFAMTMLLDNKLQEWLKRLHDWGSLPEKDRYPTEEIEQEELAKALAG